MMDPICRDSDNTNEISSLQVLNVVDDVLDAIITTQQIYYFQTTPLIKPTYYSRPWSDIEIKVPVACWKVQWKLLNGT